MAIAMTWHAGILVALILGILTAPFPAPAQVPGKVPRVGYLGTSSGGRDLEAFRQGLRDLGWIEGKTVAIEYRWSEGRSERLPGLVTELIRLNVDVIFTPGSNAAARAARDATTTIPIVFALTVDPVANGLVASLARPGGNVTGIGTAGLNMKRLELLKEMMPAITRVATLWNPANPSHQLVLEALREPARTLGVHVLPVEVRQVSELDALFPAMIRDRADALFVLGDAMLFRERSRILTLTARYRLPALYTWRQAVQEGGLMSYSEDRSDVPRRAAWYVSQILKGARPADLPVEQPTNFELVINKKTAKALGLTVPPSLLLQADHLIE